MIVRFAPEASDYIRREAAYLRRHSTHAAPVFLSRMRAAARDLSAFALAGFPDDDLPVSGIRRLMRHGYRIEYMIEDGELWIVGVSSSVNVPLEMPDDQDDYEI